MFGYRFTEKGNEEEFYRLKDLTGKMIKSLTSPIMLLLRFNDLMFKLTKQFFLAYFKPAHALFGFIEGQIKRRIKMEDIDETMEPRDLVDAFLIEKARQKRVQGANADLYT